MRGSYTLEVKENTAIPIPQLFGSVAIKQSPLGVRMHTAGYQALGIDATYTAFSSDNLLKTIKAVEALGFSGLSVSMPYKQDVIALLDEYSEDVEAIGACNTIVFESDKLIGYNTDWFGAVEAIREAVDINSLKTALIVGAGGTARAIAYGLKKSTNLEITVAARNLQSADDLRDSFDLYESASLKDLPDKNFDLIVNATPDARLSGPVTESMLHGSQALLDVVITPPVTPLAELARQNNLAVAPGWRMLLHQGVRQFKIYTGEDAPIDVMSSVLFEHIA